MELKRCPLNPEPTQSQLALFARHQFKGTSPGNPKWYKSRFIKPFEFVPMLPPRYPRWVIVPQNGVWRSTIENKRMGEPF